MLCFVQQLASGSWYSIDMSPNTLSSIFVMQGFAMQNFAQTLCGKKS
jgi:hypothetical protein